MTRTGKQILGDAGERHVRERLAAEGWEIVATNWRCAAGELDIVALDGAELVAVEVKVRRGERSGRAEEAISSAKAGRLLATMEWFVAERPEHHQRIWRIDLAAVTLDASGRVVRSTHIRNAIVVG